MRHRICFLLLPAALASAIHSEVSSDGQVRHSEEKAGPYPSYGSSYGSASYGSPSYGSPSYGSGSPSYGGGNMGGMGGSYGSGYNSYGGAQGFSQQPVVRSGAPVMAHSGQPGYGPTETEMHMPLKANVELESDDGVLFSSRRRGEKNQKGEDYNYDDNSVLGMANYVYKGNAPAASGRGLLPALLALAVLGL
mmetsp:Transcript_57177/g.107252  ORF Transcript_57177/g.107252 Transcript_57177/m.107252 type:complete len:193 (-) Transcript_57177:55-633(-)